MNQMLAVSFFFALVSLSASLHVDRGGVWMTNKSVSAEEYLKHGFSREIQIKLGLIPDDSTVGSRRNIPTKVPSTVKPTKVWHQPFVAGPPHLVHDSFVPNVRPSLQEELQAFEDSRYFAEKILPFIANGPDTPKKEPVDSELKQQELKEDQKVLASETVVLDASFWTCLSITCFFVILLVAFVLTNQRYSRVILAAKDRIRSFSSLSSLHPLSSQISSSSLEVRKDDRFDPTFLRRGSPIAEGEFSVLFLGKYKNNPIVIKVASEYDGQMAQVLLKNELRAMKQLMRFKHPNIVLFIGSFEDPDTNLHLVYEYCPLGNLKEFLRQQMQREKYVNMNGYDIDFEDLSIYGSQILDAILFVSSKGIIHGDLAARNVLVANRSLVKLADFGLSHVAVELVYALEPGKTPRLPFAWMPPELIRPGAARECTYKTDVWSFGVFLWEVFTFGEKPYADMPLADIYDHLMAGHRLPKPEILINREGSSWYEVMLATWRLNPADRPNFYQIKQLFTYTHPHPLPPPPPPSSFIYTTHL